MDAMEATRASPAPRPWRGGCQDQSPRTDCWRRKGPQTFRAGCFLNRALRGASSAKGCVASEACARRKECDIGGPKLQTYVSILTDSSLPEGIVKHKLVWDTDGVGLSGCSCVGTCIRGAVDHRRGRFSSLWGKKRMGDDAIGRARCPPRRFACRRACSERGFARIKQRHN
ncbi:hypothetical protein DPSP01_001331 [Paraphaeosphaeria sporulosa]